MKCPGCGTLYPETVIKGIGSEAIRCANCDANVTPFVFNSGYTMFFGENGDVGVTLPKEAAETIGKDGRAYMKTPENSVQNPIVTFAPHDLVGTIARMRPFLGQLGTTPSQPTPDSHNAGDFGSFLVGAPHEYATTQEELDTHRTDGHMDISRVRAGATLICPVKVPGGGVYWGYACDARGRRNCWAYRGCRGNRSFASACIEKCSSGWSYFIAEGRRFTIYGKTV